MLNAASPQGPIVIQIMKIKDDNLGKYMYSPSIIFLMDKERKMSFGVKTGIYTGVLATAITETLRNVAMLFENIYPCVELFDNQTKELLEVYDLNDDETMKRVLPVDMLRNTSQSFH